MLTRNRESCVYLYYFRNWNCFFMLHPIEQSDCLPHCTSFPYILHTKRASLIILTSQAISYYIINSTDPFNWMLFYVFKHRIAYDFRDLILHPSARLSKWIRITSIFAFYTSNQSQLPIPCQPPQPIHL